MLYRKISTEIEAHLRINNNKEGVKWKLKFAYMREKYYFCIAKIVYTALLQAYYKWIEYMAIAIKAIPTLYGEDAARFREAIEQTDREFDARPQRDITQDARYIMMKNILRKARI